MTGRGLIAYASRHSIEQAQRFGIAGVLETEVERAIVAGRKKRRSVSGVPLAADERLVWLRPEIAAVVVKSGETPGGRRRWRCTRLVHVSEPVNKKGVSDDRHEAKTANATRQSATG